jgi:hypothetical protein
MTKQSTNTRRQSLRALIANDAYAMTFQSLPQYHTALLHSLIANQPASIVPADALRADANRYQMLKKHAFNRTVQGYDGPILQWTLAVPACEDDCADFDAAMDQYGSLADYMPHYPIIAYQPAQELARSQHEQFDASKGIYWFNVLLKCARLLDLPNDEPIPSGVLKAVEALTAQQAAARGYKLLPIAPMPEMQQAGYDTPGAHIYNASYRVMVVAATSAPGTPEAPGEFRTCCDHPACTTCAGFGGFYRMASKGGV